MRQKIRYQYNWLEPTESSQSDLTLIGFKIDLEIENTIPNMQYNEKVTKEIGYLFYKRNGQG